MMEVTTFVYGGKFALLPNIRRSEKGTTCNTLVTYTNSDPDRIMVVMVATDTLYTIYLYQDGKMHKMYLNGVTSETSYKPLSFAKYYSTLYNKGYTNNLRPVEGLTFSDFRIYNTALSEEDVKDYF